MSLVILAPSLATAQDPWVVKSDFEITAQPVKNFNPFTASRHT